MSLTDRHAANGTATVLRPDADRSANGARVSRHSEVSAKQDSSIPTHSTSDRQQLLQWARDRGLLPAEPLAAPTPTPGTFDFRTIVGRVLSPNTPNQLVSAPFVEPIDTCDADLDDTQRDAVARAVQTSDLLLIQGASGTGKSRVIAEIIRQATLRENRVLFVAANGNSIDAVLQRIEHPASVRTVRLLGRDERADDLALGISQLTVAALERANRAEWITEALDIEREASAHLDRIRELTPIWANLFELADLQHQRQHEQGVISQRREAIPAEMRYAAECCHPTATGDSFADRLHALERTIAEQTSGFEGRRAQIQTERSLANEELQRVRTECDSLRPLDEAGRSGRFWSATFWKAKLNKSLPDQVACLSTRIAEIEKGLEELNQCEVSLNSDIQQAETELACERLKIVEEEINRALANLDGREAELRRLNNEAMDKFHLLCKAFPAGLPAPSALRTDSIRSCQEAATAELSGKETEAGFTRRWREFIESDRDILANRWKKQISLVAAPLSAIGTDPFLSDSAATFDLLIVDEAHQISEADLLPAARKARRWVLVGEPSPTPRILAGPDARKPKTTPDFFSRLWERLHHETWTRDGDRICCRLNPIALTDRRRLESEVVADRPDIELRILNPASGEPILAEMLFPSTMKPAETYEYLFQELGEIPCSSRIRIAQWDQVGDCLSFRTGAVPVVRGSVPPMHLAPGITLRMQDRDEFVIEFGAWDRSRAESWLERHLRMRDSGRTCRLERSYRHSPTLAAWLNEAVNCGCRYPVDQLTDGAIQFEPVPRRAPAGRRRGGAGLEIDLSDPNQRELLPNELAATLPSQGYVNLPEAQAIAEILQRLPLDRAVAVSSPYPAQVMVLRHYIKDRNRAILPSELSRLECEILVVSLTRSHVTRAVTYGNEPSTMLHLLTRPRCRLVLVGDPGTLARRAQWEGAIEHFDETAGERERRWVNVLLNYSFDRNHRPVRVAEGLKA